jgi:hypothetical protein
MLSMLDPNDQADTDNSYVGESLWHLMFPKWFTNPNENLAMLSHIWTYDVIVNKWVMQWGCICQRFWNEISRHREVLWSCSHYSAGHGEWWIIACFKLSLLVINWQHPLLRVMSICLFYHEFSTKLALKCGSLQALLFQSIFVYITAHVKRLLFYLTD